MKMSPPNINAVSTIAMFNITLALDMIYPTQSESLKIAENKSPAFPDIHQNWTWDQLQELQKLTHPNISIEWLTNEDIWYIPMMSGNAATQWRHYFTGNKKLFNANDTEEWNNYCAYEIWKDPIAIFKGFNETQPMKCHFDTINLLGPFNTTYYSDKLEKPFIGSAIFTLTDNVNYILEIRIWEDQNKDWIVFSPGTTVSNEDKDEILKHVALFGFDPLEIFIADYGNCPDVKMEKVPCHTK